jgi:peptidoglycan/LPS O-acetylase OafA/YrhL
VNTKRSGEEKVASNSRPRRPYVTELDPLRIVTALCVVAVHVLSFTLFLNHSDLGTQIQNAFVVSMHFTREMFMFVTGFALAYVYYGKPFAFKHFWKRRSIGVIMPYVIWSFLYVLVNKPASSPLHFIEVATIATLTGTASYQLYYILMTIQFYILLPVFLLFLKYAEHRPWKVLGVSFALEVVMLYLDYHLLQRGTLASSGILQVIAQYQASFVLTYQFFFVLGGLTALYFQQVRAFLLRHGTWVAGASLLAIAALWIHYFLQIYYYHEPMDLVLSVLQPIMVFYSLGVIALLLWLTCRWVSRARPGERPWGFPFWHSLSDASFGIYLVHAMILTVVLRQVIPVMPETWPVAIRVFLTWFLVGGGAAAITVIMLRIPLLSRLVGREGPTRRREPAPSPVNAPAPDYAPAARHREVQQTR